jgi:acyl carrier protein
VPSSHLKKFITVETKTKPHKLTCSEYARWLCLIEALDVVSRGAEKFKVDLNSKDIDWIKPLSFQKYVAERFESMIDEVLEQEFNVKIPLNRFKECTTLQEPALL